MASYCVRRRSYPIADLNNQYVPGDIFFAPCPARQEGMNLSGHPLIVLEHTEEGVLVAQCTSHYRRGRILLTAEEQREAGLDKRAKTYVEAHHVTLYQLKDTWRFHRTRGRMSCAALARIREQLEEAKPARRNFIPNLPPAITSRGTVTVRLAPALLGR